MPNLRCVFQRQIPGLGDLSLRPFDLRHDCEFLHDWVRRDYAFFWGMLDAGLDEVMAEYAELSQRPGYQILVGEYQQQVAFLLEYYDPRHDRLAEHYPVQAGDRGLHLIVAPHTGDTIANFTWHIFTFINDFVFSDSDVNRIVVEPDIRNKKMFALCQRVGFELAEVIELPHKTAQLAFCHREHYQALLQQPNIQKRSAMNHYDNAVSPQQAVAHITAENWQQANRHLVAKAIAEFTHERLITPIKTQRQQSGLHRYHLVVNETVRYEFDAKMMALNHLYIDEASIQKLESDEPASLDAVLLIKELQRTIGMADEVIPSYLEELISTLSGYAYKLHSQPLTAQQLAGADFQTLERSMVEGHPGFVANNGRIGFNSSEYQSYAPEAGNLFSLLWLAGHKSRTRYAGMEDLSYQTLLHQELDGQTIARFNAVIEARGEDPDEYLFIPIHPWQWFNKLATTFATEIASNRLICLGYSPDQYLAQQSVRTLFNNSAPHKRYVKSALSILNMGFMRGLPMYYLGTAPTMAAWLEQLFYNDAYIEKCGFRMLSEVASVSYINDYFAELGPHHDFNKMLASLWRESPYGYLKAGQTPVTMAALLHIDGQGKALLPELVRASRLSVGDWLQRYLQAYLAPMLHCFYQYDLVFMPHGENIILVLEDHAPVACLLKDITEEAAILSKEIALPAPLQRMYAEVPEEVKLLSIFTDIFDGFFRYLTPILEQQCGYDEQRFWQQVARCVQVYQAQFPEHQEKYQRYDLFADEFTLSCLNRLQLNNNKRMVDLDNPVASLQFMGHLKNPLAQFKTTTCTATEGEGINA